MALTNEQREQYIREQMAEFNLPYDKAAQSVDAYTEQGVFDGEEIDASNEPIESYEQAPINTNTNSDPWDEGGEAELEPMTPAASGGDPWEEDDTGPQDPWDTEDDAANSQLALTGNDTRDTIIRTHNEIGDIETPEVRVKRAREEQPERFSMMMKDDYVLGELEADDAIATNTERYAGLSREEVKKDLERLGPVKAFRAKDPERFADLSDAQLVEKFPELLTTEQKEEKRVEGLGLLDRAREGYDHLTEALWSGQERLGEEEAKRITKEQAPVEGSAAYGAELTSKAYEDRVDEEVEALLASDPTLDPDAIRQSVEDDIKSDYRKYAAIAATAPLTFSAAVPGVAPAAMSVPLRMGIVGGKNAVLSGGLQAADNLSRGEDVLKDVGSEGLLGFAAGSLGRGVEELASFVSPTRRALAPVAKAADDAEQLQTARTASFEDAKAVADEEFVSSITRAQKAKADAGERWTGTDYKKVVDDANKKFNDDIDGIRSTFDDVEVMPGVKLKEWEEAANIGEGVENIRLATGSGRLDSLAKQVDNKPLSDLILGARTKLESGADFIEKLPIPGAKVISEVAGLRPRGDHKKVQAALKQVATDLDKNTTSQLERMERLFKINAASTGKVGDDLDAAVSANKAQMDGIRNSLDDALKMLRSEDYPALNKSLTRVDEELRGLVKVNAYKDERMMITRLRKQVRDLKQAAQVSKETPKTTKTGDVMRFLAAPLAGLAADAGTAGAALAARIALPDYVKLTSAERLSFVVDAMNGRLTPAQEMMVQVGSPLLQIFTRESLEAAGLIGLAEEEAMDKYQYLD